MRPPIDPGDAPLEIVAADNGVFGFKRDPHHGGVRGCDVIVRSWILHGAFAAGLGLVAALAAGTALGTSGPWYSAVVSSQVYSVSLLGAIVLAAFLASLAGSRAGHLDEIVRSLDLRLAGLPEAMMLPEDRDAIVARTVIVESVAGPLAGCLTFAVAAGAMLPAVEGFAAVHFQLNTAVLLFLAYGWTCLVGWALVGVGLLGARSATKVRAPPKTKAHKA